MALVVQNILVVGYQEAGLECLILGRIGARALGAGVGVQSEGMLETVATISHGKLSASLMAEACSRECGVIFGRGYTCRQVQECAGQVESGLSTGVTRGRQVFADVHAPPPRRVVAVAQVLRLGCSQGPWRGVYSVGGGTAAAVWGGWERCDGRLLCVLPRSSLR
jgi:hypothetical protein